MAVFDVAAVPKAHLHQDLEKVVASIPSLNSFAKSPGIPPTAVGGWFKSCPRGAEYEQTFLSITATINPGSIALKERRLDLNNPQTAVGGI